MGLFPENRKSVGRELQSEFQLGRRKRYIHKQLQYNGISTKNHLGITPPEWGEPGKALCGEIPKLGCVGCIRDRGRGPGRGVKGEGTVQARAWGMRENMVGLRK